MLHFKIQIFVKQSDKRLNRYAFDQFESLILFHRCSRPVRDPLLSVLASGNLASKHTGFLKEAQMRREKKGNGRNERYAQEERRSSGVQVDDEGSGAAAMPSHVQLAK
ncbi:hypothetical protein K0M31_016476 [Melipona bicolor]|uniref:Uncharacterized protein n=1 Tax=Melipona bicolor TaxID=60889 RepID=A0AA40G7H7_9HYME|nr:hypothetical protein K0M31_016476 [Melipona bicolor]